MTDINAAAEAARENARQDTGQFGAQPNTAPELSIAETRTPLTIITTAMLSKNTPIPYPAELPAGGKITAAFEDHGGVYVSIEFEDQVDVNGDPVRLALGGDADSGNDWTSIANDEPGFEDDNLNDYALSYLRDVHTAVDSDAGTASYAAVGPHFDTFVARATAPAPAPDYSDDAWAEKSRTRGELLVGAFADGGNDLEDNAADAIADILAYAKSQGLDVGDITRRAIEYNEDA